MSLGARGFADSQTLVVKECVRGGWVREWGLGWKCALGRSSFSVGEFCFHVKVSFLIFAQLLFAQGLASHYQAPLVTSLELLLLDMCFPTQT